MISCYESKSATKSNSKDISKYIEDYRLDYPILISDLYAEFPDMKQGSIRQIMKRLHDTGIIEKAAQGVYYKPNPNRTISTNNLSTGKIVEEKYLNYNGKVVGYKSGIVFANQLGLTTQVASIEIIISNVVSNKKRKIDINNGKIIVNAPRVEVTDQNYKLLQILDLMNDFDALSEIELESAIPIIKEHLRGLNLTRKDIEFCVDQYPLQAQVNFYKMGVYNEFTNEKRNN